MAPLALTYHDVVDAGEQSGFGGVSAERYKLSRARFASHLDAIAGVPDRGGGVLLTFDDGGVSATRTIAPMLAERDLAAHFYITTARLGTPGFVSAAGVRELASAGHLIGAHGHSHRVMTRLADDELLDEWRRSRAILEDALGEPVTTASVPTGFYDARVGRLAAEAGLTRLFTSEPWVRSRALGGLRVHGRFAVVSTTSAARIRALARRSRPALAREAASWHSRKAAKASFGPAYARVRAELLSRRARG